MGGLIWEGLICLFVCLFVFFILKLLQYCNYIIIVMQIKLMLLLLLILYGACNGGPGIVRNVPNPARTT